jgi:hypothetical protein
MTLGREEEVTINKIKYSFASLTLGQARYLLTFLVCSPALIRLFEMKSDDYDSTTPSNKLPPNICTTNIFK